MSYAVKDIFATLQGEGARAGTPAVFLRMAGCNLWNGREEDRHKGLGDCARWCDTDFAKGSKMESTEIVHRLEELWSEHHAEKWVVVTGGEPLLQFTRDLLRDLHKAGWKVAVETNGTIDFVDSMYLDWVCVSPKIGGQLKYRGRCDELKVILHPRGSTPKGWGDEDLVRMAEKLKPEHRFVQPLDPTTTPGIGTTYLLGYGTGARLDDSVERCVAFCMEHPGWRVSAQTHKYLKLP